MFSSKTLQDSTKKKIWRGCDTDTWLTKETFLWERPHLAQSLTSASAGPLPERGGKAWGLHDIQTCKSEERIWSKTRRKCNARQKERSDAERKRGKVFRYRLELLPYSISCFFDCIFPSPVFGGHVSSVRWEMKEEMLCWESVITLVNWVIHHLKSV